MKITAGLGASGTMGRLCISRKKRLQSEKETRRAGVEGGPVEETKDQSRVGLHNEQRDQDEPLPKFIRSFEQ